MAIAGAFAAALVFLAIAALFAAAESRTRTRRAAAERATSSGS